MAVSDWLLHFPIQRVNTLRKQKGNDTSHQKGQHSSHLNQILTPSHEEKRNVIPLYSEKYTGLHKESTSPFFNTIFSDLFDVFHMSMSVYVYAWSLCVYVWPVCIYGMLVWHVYIYIYMVTLLV